MHEEKEQQPFAPTQESKTEVRQRQSSKNTEGAKTPSFPLRYFINELLKKEEIIFIIFFNVHQEMERKE